MKDRKTVAKEILKLIDKETDKLCVPIQQGNSVSIKHMVVRESDHGFSVTNAATNEKVAHTFSKTAAVAIAKNHARDMVDQTTQILRIDDQIQQKYNDCVHFKHTMYLSEDEDRKYAAEIRYEVAWDDVITLRSELDHYIFD
jgi:hypothetical protein